MADTGDGTLHSAVLRANSKSFFLDLKSNARGRYLKIAEKGRYRAKSSIVVPSSGLSPLIATFRYYIDEDAAGRVGGPADIIVDSKVFSFSAGSNERGHFLRIFESGGGNPTGGTSLMVPAGWANTHWKLFLSALESIAREHFSDVIDLEALLSGDPAANISSTLGASGTEEAVLTTKELGPVLSVGGKHFFFEMRSNERGAYLKVKELSGNIRNMLVIPLHAIARFQEAISLAMQQQPIQDSAKAEPVPPGPPTTSDREPGGSSRAAAGPGARDPTSGSASGLDRTTATASMARQAARPTPGPEPLRHSIGTRAGALAQPLPPHSPLYPGFQAGPARGLRSAPGQMASDTQRPAGGHHMPAPSHLHAQQFAPGPRVGMPSGGMSSSQLPLSARPSAGPGAGAGTGLSQSAHHGGQYPGPHLFTQGPLPHSAMMGLGLGLAPVPGPPPGLYAQQQPLYPGNQRVLQQQGHGLYMGMGGR